MRATRTPSPRRAARCGHQTIELLPWGQDLNGTGPGAGKRPASEFDPTDCTGGNSEPRAAYLVADTDLLIGDLEWMTAFGVQPIAFEGSDNLDNPEAVFQ